MEQQNQADIIIDFSQFEKLPEFRADYLFFIRLIYNYIGTIFLETFPKGGQDNKSAKKRRKNFLQILDELEENSYNDFKYIIDYFGGNHKFLDCSSKSFEDLLDKIIEYNLSLALCDKLQGEHAILYRVGEQINLLNLQKKDGSLPKKQKGKKTAINYQKENEELAKNIVRDLKSDLEKLRKKRNYLEHYSPDKDSQNDEEIIEIMGKFLLPDLNYMFLGRIKHYKTRLEKELIKKNSKSNLLPHMVDRLQKMLDDANKKRRKNNKLLFEFFRSKKNISMRDNKSKRKALFDKNQSWHKEYQAISQQSGDYKEHRFKIRYSFIGQRNIDRIKEMLNYKPNEDAGINKDGYIAGNLSFKRDIEPIYYLAQKINLIIHRTLSLCRNEKYEKELRKRFLKRWVGSIRRQKQYKNEIKNCNKQPRKMKVYSAIRNTLAHNGMFWEVKENGKELSIKQIFERVILAINNSAHLENDKNSDMQRRILINDFKTQILRLLKKERYALKYISASNKQSKPALKKIKKWKKEEIEFRSREKIKTQKGQAEELNYNYYMRRSVLLLLKKWRNYLTSSLDKCKKNR